MKQKKHLLATRLLLSLLALLTASTAWADPSGDWSSYKAASFSVIDENAKTISITSEAELALLGYNTRSTSQYYEGYTITLTRNLDMSAHKWDVPIGKWTDGFKGTFDGNNHTISGITLNKGTGYGYQGLFGYVRGTVKNLILEKSSITAQSNVGGIAGYNYSGTIQNCHVLASVSVYTSEGNSNSLGGVAGCNEGTLRDCTSAASVTATSSTPGVGGIAGEARGPISSCHYYGSNVSGQAGKSGAIGGRFLDNNITISDCYYTMNGIDGIGNSYQGTYTPIITNVSHGNQLTLGENITTTTAATTFTVPAHDEMNSEGTEFISVAATTYSLYVTGQSITLGYSGSGTVVYAVNGESIVGDTFSMPEGGATVSLYAGGSSAPVISGLTYNSTYGFYEITDAAALNALATYVNGGNNASGLRFVQTADIDMQNVSFTPIGNTYAFSGTYDGDGYVILNISHTTSGAGAVSGLFGSIAGGTVRNVNLKDCSFSGSRAGGIAGDMNQGTIDNCTVIGGTVSCGTNGYSGGIVGYFYAGTVKDCFTTTTVSAYSTQADMNGPIVGRNGGNTTNNYYTIAVAGGRTNVGTQISGGFITLGEGVMITDGVFRTIGRTEEHTYHFAQKDKDVTLSADVPATGMKKFTATGATASLTETLGQYTLTMPANDVTVSLADVTPTITIDASALTYTGTALTPAITSVRDGETAMTADTDYTNVAYSNNVNAGEASVSITGKGWYLGTASQTFTIAKATPTVTAPSAIADLVYNGSAQALVTAGSTDFGTLIYSTDGDTYSTDIPTATDAGTYTVYYKVEESDNWNAVAAQSVEVTITATFAPDPAHFSQDGDTYTIHTAEGWNVFCDMLADNAKGYFTGKTIVLGADITVTRMAGGSGHDFTGTFDGGGHTLTVNYTATEDNCAPFRSVESGCLIENLHVTGTITTSAKYAAGIIAQQYGAVTIRNCRVSVAISSSVSGDGTHGGLVAANNSTSGSNITIEGCLFDGRLLGSSTNSVGGFIGWRGGAATISNSLFAPTEVTVQNDNSATFARNKVDTYNSYYTHLLNDGTNYVPYLNEAVTPAVWNNGKARRTVTAGADVTISAIALTGTTTEYTVSGITAYSGGGLQHGDDLYYGSGDQLELTLSNTAPAAPAGYQYDGYTASAGTLSGSTLLMPDQDVTISLALAAIAYTITYDLAGGTVATENPTSYTVESEAITLINPTRDGFTFAGWTGTDLTEATETVTIAQGSTGDRTYTATWTKNELALNETDGVTTLTSQWAGKQVEVSFTRTFSSGVASTVCLPFGFEPQGGTFYTFHSVDKSSDPWTVTMNEADPDNRAQTDADGKLLAGVPYLFMPAADGAVSFNGTMDVPTDASTVQPVAQAVTGGWQFVGTFSRIDWTTDPQTVYGFAALPQDSQTTTDSDPAAGVFFRVKGGSNSFALPFRAYLDAAGGGAQNAPARGTSRAASEPLPDMMTVRLVGINGTTTAIGTLDTSTGSVTIDDDSWYTLDGRKLDGKPTAKGLYIHNGRKIIIK